MTPRPNPADERRYPVGCPDADWCRGNGCFWNCQGDPDEGVDDEPFDHLAARWDHDRDIRKHER
jgi:hypothetical protein